MSHKNGVTILNSKTKMCQSSIFLFPNVLLFNVERITYFICKYPVTLKVFFSIFKKVIADNDRLSIKVVLLVVNVKLTAGGDRGIKLARQNHLA